MSVFSNVILIVMFTAIAIWLFHGWYKTRNLKYKDKQWTTGRILFLIAGILCVLTAFVYSTLLDWLRLITMMLCVVGFLLLRDGVGDDGLAVLGKLTPYSNIRAYDYGDYKKEFRVYAITNDSDGSDPNVIVSLTKEEKEEVIRYLKKMMGKKYTRLKKG
ncbi:MAG: hypothetical protein IJ225_02270 [Solobacterium sp.]|nr:hypothetical protein [Solobacterium sp.]